jgi:hypothetical protein
MSTSHNTKDGNSTMLTNKRTNRVNDFVKKHISNPRDIDYSSIKRNIIEDIHTKLREAEAIKKAEIVKEAETAREVKPIKKVQLAKEIVREKAKKTPCNSILSAAKWVDSNIVEKYLNNKPTGITDPIWTEYAYERRRRKQIYEWKRREEDVRRWNKIHGNK